MNQHPRFLLAAAAVLLAIAVGACSKGPEVSTANPAAIPASANVSDIDVTEHVKTALHQAELLRGVDITVVTLKGDVRLTGVLDSQAQIDDAIRIARAAEGAHTIHDELTLRK
jgi:hyperosmotically inducible protein